MRRGDTSYFLKKCAQEEIETFRRLSEADSSCFPKVIAYQKNRGLTGYIVLELLAKGTILNVAEKNE